MYVVLYCSSYLTLLAQVPAMMGMVLFSAGDFAGLVVMIVGAGLYFAVRLRTTAAAVASTVCLCLLFSSAFNPMRSLLFASIYRLAGRAASSALIAVAVVMICIRVGIGWLCIKAAVRGVRRNVF
jgi:hypothetical protein